MKKYVSGISLLILSCTAAAARSVASSGDIRARGNWRKAHRPLAPPSTRFSRDHAWARLRGGSSNSSTSSSHDAKAALTIAEKTKAQLAGSEPEAKCKAIDVRGGFVGSVLAKLFHLERHELPKFLAMSSMMFGIIYIFTMTRDTKDTLIVTNCGAEAIAFLKVYGVVPAAALFMVLYNHASNHLSHRWLFRVTLTPFLGFYGVFAAVMYPNRGRWHHAGGALAKGEHGWAYLINLGRFWMFSLYYIVSELWGSAGVPLLFWTCANDVTPVSQAKRLYPLLALLGNMAPIASGYTMKYVTRHRDPSLPQEVAFEQSIKILSTIMLGAGAVVLGLYEYVMHMHEGEQRAKRRSEEAAAIAAGGKQQARAEGDEHGGAKEARPKMGLIDSFKFLSKSRYLGYMGLIVMAYGLSMEFTEIIWKAIVKLAYPDKSDYMTFMGQYSSIVGMATVVMLLLGNRVIKYLGWEFGALMTPLMMALLATPFFGYITLGDIQHSRARLMIAVYVGMVQNVLSKATKYALFDPTKEMAYIPLDKEYKVKGKAAIDVLGARLGKSGGALVQQALVVVCGTILTGAPVLAAMFALVNAMWISSVLKLGQLFHQKVKDNERQKQLQDAAAAAAAAGASYGKKA